jgi:hypothetical protein
MRTFLFLAAALALLLASTSASARKSAEHRQRTSASDVISRDRLVEPGGPEVLTSSAVATTLVLANYKFDSGATCTAQGWTTVDITAQTGTYWHVDDFALSNSLGDIPLAHTSAAGLSFNAIQGTKSMWMGQRIPPPGPIDTIHCGYVALPGYGNGWNQSFCTKNCIAVAGGATPDLDVAFKLKFDSEPSYDSTLLEFTTDCAGTVGWTELDGGIGVWDAAAPSLTPTIIGSYDVSGTPVKVRLRFMADSAWSNQDGLYAGFGTSVDSLSVETLPVEDFEGEAVGATSSNDWEICNTPGYGNYLALFRRADANYEDQCRDNLSCYWAAIQGSTEFYTCGNPPQPSQRVVPHVNARGEYISNEIWSPVIPLGGSGTEFRLRYTVYEDLPLDNIVFHVWHVRTIGASGCPGPWKDRNFVHYGDSKTWVFRDFAIGSKVDANGVGIQIALGVIDMCPFWCGVLGTGSCHSPAPYFDQVKVLRVDISGPQWDVRAIDTYQDTFSNNGTITGTARIDNAVDIRPYNSTTVQPGDSAIAMYLIDANYVTGVGTNASGLSPDPNISTFIGRHKTKRQAYMWVQTWPYDGVDDPGDKVGEDLSEGPGGQANRYPFAGTQMVNGTLWTKIRMDYTYTGTANNAGDGATVPSTDPIIQNRFNVDINDNLFTPGDTILYFFSATSAGGTTYYSTESGTTDDVNVIAVAPMEATVLPAGGFNRGGDILYVDGADGFGIQPYFEGALMVLGLSEYVDRFDVRGPSSATSNRLGGLVKNITNQLNACYSYILWDCGSLSVTLGDGSGDPEKTDDYALLNTFLSNLSTPGGVYLSGNRVAEYLINYSGASAISFRTNYMPFTLTSRNHRLAPTFFPIAPTIVPWPGRAFDDNTIIYGGCPELSDFDVLAASGSSLVQMSYNTASSPHAAVLSKVNGNARVVMSGFSFGYIRDNEINGTSDRAQFLFNVLQILGAYDGVSFPVDAGDPSLINSLAQNYPNPFNPTTTIAFSLKTRGNVALNVYDVGGRLVRQLVNEVRAAGAHTLTWDGRDGNRVAVASGVYFYRLGTPGFSQTRKMVLLK